MTAPEREEIKELENVLGVVWGQVKLDGETNLPIDGAIIKRMAKVLLERRRPQGVGDDDRVELTDKGIKEAQED